VAQIILDLEIGIEAEGQRFPVLQVAAEFAVQRLLRKISHMRGHARHRETALGPDALREIIAVAPIGIGHDRRSVPHFAR